MKSFVNTTTKLEMKVSQNKFNNVQIIICGQIRLIPQMPGITYVNIIYYMNLGWGDNAHAIVFNILEKECD